MPVSNHKEKIVFIIVGVTSALTYYATYFLLRHFEATPPLATLFAYIAGIIISYCGHAWFTFKTPIADGGQAIRYILATLIGAAAVAFATYIVLKFTESDIIILIVATMIVPVLNWVVFKHFVYIDGRQDAA